MACLAPWTGCNKPNHRAAVEDREQKMQRTVAMLADMENERPRNMQRTVAALQQMHTNDIEHTNQNAVGLDRAIRAEFDRWRQDQPTYRKRFEELMQGNPANFDHTLPYIIY